VLSTVLFTDIVDSTNASPRLATADGECCLSDMTGRAAAVSPLPGQEVKSLGDGFLATFDGPSTGVRCAVAISDSGAGR